MSYTPTANGYFSGGGLFEIGFMQAGVKMLQSLDLDKKATDCMKANPKYFNHKIITASIEDVTVASQDKSDIMVFTYPCTDYSTAADIHGSRTGDHLFLHSLRHIALREPEMYYVENVPGMKKFQIVMEAMTQLPRYYVNIVCPIDASTWLPQKRKRMILIGTKKPFFITPPMQISNRPRIKDILEKNVEIEIPQYVLNRLYGKGNYRDKPIIVDPEQPGALAPTCVAHYAKDLGTRLVKDKSFEHGVRPFTIREWARLQGVPDDFEFANELNSYRIIGNGVPTPLGRWCGLQAMRYFNN